MSFQAYLANIKSKTGKSPDDFRALAEAADLLRADTKATEITNWLKQEFGLGHGHAMAIWAVFKQEGWVASHRRRDPGSDHGALAGMEGKG